MKFKLASNIMIALLSLVLIFHFLILFQIISFKNVWGGQLTNENEMYVFETVSILLNALLLFTILQKANYIKPFFNSKFISILLWIFVFIFALNTLGNLFATNLFEQIIGTFLTLVSAYLCFVIVREKVTN